MKNVLDIFLKQNDMTRYDLSKQVGISEQTLSKASKRDPETYSVKTLVAISSGTGYSPGEVLDKLLAIRDSDIVYVASTLKEIRQKVNEKEDVFIIRGEFSSLMKEIKQSSLSEAEELGFQLGMGGAGSYLVWIINRIINSFGSNKEEENLKDDIMTLYTIELLNSSEAKLRLKQLDY